MKISLLRSVLYAPADRQRVLDKLPGLSADGFIIDLEDAVAPTQKASGREMMRTLLRAPDYRASLGDRLVGVRINALGSVHGTEDLLAALGFGGVTLQQVVNRLREEVRLSTAAAAPVLSNEDLARSVSDQPMLPPPSAAETGGSPILGLEGLEYRLGGCCCPLPGEAIVGSVALGNHGITIHRQDCSNVAAVPVERRLPVRWNPAADQQHRRYPVQIRIEVLDRVGVLKDILTRLSDSRINVSDARVRTAYGKPARIDLKVELASASQLGTTMDQIRSMADVLDLCRTGIG